MLDVKSICCGYGQTDVLNDITFSVEKGECIGIIGPNGSGKSTLLKTLSRTLKPTSGSIVMLDKGLRSIFQQGACPQHGGRSAGCRRGIRLLLPRYRDHGPKPPS